MELYRRSLAPIVGRRITRAIVPDPWFVKGGMSPRALREALSGTTVVGLRRRGKLLLIDLAAAGSSGDPGSGDGSEVATVLGVRFGMTGRPVLDDGQPIMTLLYSSHRLEPAWDRFALEFGDGGRLRINDPRRLGGVELDPDEDRLGPDAFTLDRSSLRQALRSRSAVKAVLLDQERIAGIGNLLGDEILWRAGIDPARPAAEVGDEELVRLHRTFRSVLKRQLALGGSHTGRLATAVRERGPFCPADGTPLTRRTIGGRTTYSCPVHQH